MGSVVYWYGCPYWYTQLFPESTLESAKVPWRKRNLLISMMDTCEIEYTLVPDTKEKSDLWKHFNLREQKTDGRLILMLLYVNSAISLSDVWEAPQTFNSRWSVELILMLLYANSAIPLSDVWEAPQTFNSRQSVELILMLLYVNSAIPLSDVREAPQTFNSKQSATIPYHHSFCLFPHFLTPCSTFGGRRIHW